MSKLAGEAYCSVFTGVYGLPTVALRYFNVYGPRQNPDSEYSAVIPKFIRAALRGEPLTIYGDGQQTRDFTYVTDVVHANVLASTSDQTGTFNTGGGSSITILELAEAVLGLASSRSTIECAPARPGDIAHSLADISRAESIGWRPQVDTKRG